jgi:hypothetical protein
MPTTTHEILIDLLRAAPETLGALIRTLGEPELQNELTPDARFEVVDATLNQPAPTELRADLVVRVLDGARAILAVVVEVQLRVAAEKQYVWPLYEAAVFARERCPVVLAVLTPHLNVARWAEQTIALGPFHRTQPWVLGPHNFPRVHLNEMARYGQTQTLLSAFVHKHDPEASELIYAGIVAADGLDQDRAGVYHDLLLRHLDQVARSALEAFMEKGTFEIKSEFLLKYIAQGEALGKAEGEAKGKAEGEAKGKSEALLAIAAARNLNLTDEHRDLVLSTRELAQLDRWIIRAATASTVEDLFAADA